MSGPTLAIMEIGEYYEKMLLLAVVALFFINSNWYSWIIAIIACLGVYFIEIVIDNVSARIKLEICIECLLVNYAVVWRNQYFDLDVDIVR